MPDVLKYALLAVFPAIVLYAALNDFRHYRIPNRLNLLLAASFFPVAWLLGMPWEVMKWHIIGGLTVFGVVFLLFMLVSEKKFGGGDAKMIAATAFWIDWQHLPTFIVMTVIFGGVLGLVMWLWRVLQIEIHVWTNGDNTLRKLSSYHVVLPYGAAIASGGIYAYVQSWWQTLLP